MSDFFCDIMECLLTVPSAKCDQIENESGPFSYRKADCNAIPVHITTKGSKLGVHEFKTLDKASKTNTGDFSIYRRKLWLKFGYAGKYYDQRVWSSRIASY